jgi:uncharacterized RDD family membrane protein YckC
MSDLTPEVPPSGEVPPPGSMPPPPAFPAQQYGAPQYGAMPSAGLPAAGLPPSAYANWGLRVVSYLIDGVIAGVFYLIGLILDGPHTSLDSNGMMTSNGGGIIFWIFWLIAIAVGIWNVVIRQGRTGQSLGKQVVGTQCLKESTMAPLGPGMQFARSLAHILDGFCLIGYLWPIWDAKRQTFADKIVGTVVVAKPKT